MENIECENSMVLLKDVKIKEPVSRKVQLQRNAAMRRYYANKIKPKKEEAKKALIEAGVFRETRGRKRKPIVEKPPKPPRVVKEKIPKIPQKRGPKPKYTSIEEMRQVQNQRMLERYHKLTEEEKTELYHRRKLAKENKNKVIEMN